MRLPAIVLGLAVCVLAAAATSAAPPCPGAGHGKRLIHGGGKSSQDYTRRGLDLCGGSQARVVLVPYAAVSVDEPAADQDGPLGSKAFNESYSKLWTDAGATSVTVLDLTDVPGSVAAVGQADYVFFGGGDQVDLMKWLARTPAVMDAIRKRHEEGALVGGMSAGAAAMSRLMIHGGDTADVTAIKSGGTLIGEGLGFWPEVITDQHFVKRQRFARLVSAVLDNPGFPGIAIDEATTVLVGERELEVFGIGNVVVFDARQAKVGAAAKGENQSATGIRMSVLRAGDRFNWRKGIPAR